MFHISKPLSAKARGLSPCTRNRWKVIWSCLDCL